MRRSISRWTMSLATAGVLALPVTSYARPAQQTPPQQQPAQPSPAQPQPDQPQPAQPPAQPQPERPQPQEPQPTEPQPTQQPTTSAAQSTTDQAVSPQEHLRQAQQAVSGISAASVPAKNRSQIADLKRHLSNLEKMGSSPSASTTQPTGGTANKSTNATKNNSNNWGTEVAAVDKIITEMVGNDTSAGAPTSTPGATGTSGSTKSPSAIDDATRAKLMDVRTHITAYAAGMAGSSSTPKTEAASSASPSAATAAHAEPSMTANSPASSQPAATPQSTSSAPSPSSSQPSSTASSQSPAAGSQNPQNPPATQPNPNAAAGAAPQPSAEGQPPSTAGQQPSAAAGQPMNTEEAHKQLVAARDTLSQLTQLPAAAQLNGEARTQVAQLITNFNELIANPPDWHVSYQKVAGNLNTLIGPDNTDAEAQGGAPTTATGATAAPGTVGTSGAASVELDPSIRAKLVEFRRNLAQFEKSAGGSK